MNREGTLSAMYPAASGVIKSSSGLGLDTREGSLLQKSHFVCSPVVDIIFPDSYDHFTVSAGKRERKEGRLLVQKKSAEKKCNASFLPVPGAE